MTDATYVGQNGEEFDTKTGKHIEQTGSPDAPIPNSTVPGQQSPGAGALAPQSPMTARFMKGMDKLDMLQQDERQQFEKGEAAAQPKRDELMRVLDSKNAATAHLEKLKAAPKPEDYQKGSMEFASAMALMGAVAGRFTRAGGTASLNAFSGALKGWHEGNMEAYANAQKEWEANTKATLENNQMEIEKYREIIENKKLNIDQMSAALTLAAQPFQNRLMFDYAQEKNINGALNLYDKMVGIQEKAETAFQKMMGFNEYDKGALKSTIDQYNQHPEQLAGLTNEQFQSLRIAGERFGFKLNNPADGAVPFKGQARPMTPQQEALKSFLSENPGATSAQIQAFNQSGRGARSAIGIYMDKYRQEHPNATSDEIKRAEQMFSTQTTAQNRFLSGPQGNTIRSLNVVESHLKTMQDLATELRNGNMPRFNQIAQRFAEETGQPAPTNFDTAKQIVGTEIIKALGVAGAGTQAERQEAGDAFMRSRSPQQIQGAINVVQQLLGGQLKGLRRQYTSSTGLPESSFDEMLEPETREVLGGGGGGASTSAPPAAAIQHLRDNPSLKSDFDAKYGPGSADSVLGGT